MSKKYKGNNSLQKKLLISANMACFQIKTDKNNISYLQKILEGYENIAFVAPLDPKAGLLLIQTTEDMAKDVLNALKSLDIPIYYI